LISVILNAYKRTEYLQSQIDAINNQTIKPVRIYVWQNAACVIPEHIKSQVTFIECNKNLGVWARFAFALNVETEFVCMFDDDTIPGLKWFENCLNTMKTHEGLLGTRGLRFISKGRYHPFISFGWDGPTSGVTEVDIVGHSWFFKREWLAAFWRELPPLDASKIAGEDIHFSYTIQKYLGLKTYVPPHPLDDLDLWGSRPETAVNLGSNEAAISVQHESLSRFNKALDYYCNKGFKIVIPPLDRLAHGLTIGKGLRANKSLRFFLAKNPWLFKIAKKIGLTLEKLKIYL
jgi:hypothetical protein